MTTRRAVPETVRVVFATRDSVEVFRETSPLARSLAASRRVETHQMRGFTTNTVGLPRLYNRAIEEAADKPALLVFAHDDLLLCDVHWAARIREALDTFDIVGLAGARRRLPRQPAWIFPDMRLRMDDRAHLSGCVGHGDGFPPTNVSIYGPVGVEVKLLDGLLLACDSRVLHEHGLRFDERFDFDFYDMDFCRSAEQRGLRMGTVALSVVHTSKGAFGSPRWREGYRRYLDKWGE